MSQTNTESMEILKEVNNEIKQSKMDAYNKQSFITMVTEIFTKFNYNIVFVKKNTEIVGFIAYTKLNDETLCISIYGFTKASEDTDVFKLCNIVAYKLGMNKFLIDDSNFDNSIRVNKIYDKMLLSKSYNINIQEVRNYFGNIYDEEMYKECLVNNTYDFDPYSISIYTIKSTEETDVCVLGKASIELN